MFVNYTIRAGSRFDQTKIRLSVNNLFEEHNLTSLGIKGTALTEAIATNGASYKDPFNTLGPTPVSGLDQLGALPGRSITLVGDVWFDSEAIDRSATKLRASLAQVAGFARSFRSLRSVVAGRKRCRRAGPEKVEFLAKLRL